MCGLLGSVYSPTEREPDEQSYLKWIFTYLLILSEKRGPYATGISWLKSDGSHSIFKRPIGASEFVKERLFMDVLSQVDDDTTWLAGHTRWPTRGSHLDNDNNHPILVGNRLLGCHNGTVTNADALFKRLDLPRFAEVDSEIIFRMAHDTMCDGRIDVVALKERLALCRGQMSAVLASKLDPRRVIVIKGNMPLKLRYHSKYKVMIYASDGRYLDVAAPRDLGWKHIQTRPMSIMTFCCDDLPSFESLPLVLMGAR